MPGIRYALLINGVPVVSASAELDVITAERLRMAVLAAGRRGHATVVVDLTRTRFCDSAGLSVLADAHRRALADGGELRLVLPADGPVVRVLTMTGLDRRIPSFTSLAQALALAPITFPPSRPRPCAGPRSPAGQPCGGPAGGR